jgi:uncharacterized RDD family membrane protein YckC
MDVNVEEPQKLKKVQLAGIGKRIIGILIDTVILWVVGMIIGALLGLNYMNPANIDWTAFYYYLLIYFIIFFGYFTILEGPLGNGRTIGKRIVGTKVVKEEDQSVMGYGDSFIRNIIRLIDGIFIYLVGFIFISTSKKEQRLGDRAVHTIVIRA